MSTIFFVFVILSALGLAGLLFWSQSGSSERGGTSDGLSVLENAPRHLTHLAQIRQALGTSDMTYVREKGGPLLVARMKRERRQVTLLYLAAVRSDFDQLLRIARVIAMLSPGVSGSHEYERMRLEMMFRCRFQLLKLRVTIGAVSVPDVTALGQMVTSLAVEMESAMEKLGERAALAAELALQSDP